MLNRPEARLGMWLGVHRRQVVLAWWFNFFVPSTTDPESNLRGSSPISWGMPDKSIDSFVGLLS